MPERMKYRAEISVRTIFYSIRSPPVVRTRPMHLVWLKILDGYDSEYSNFFTMGVIE